MNADARLKQDCQAVIDRLGPYPRVRVQVDQGWVSLRGDVPRGVDRWKVQEAVCRLAGVVGANVQLGVCPADGGAFRA